MSLLGNYFFGGGLKAKVIIVNYKNLLSINISIFI